MSSTSTLPQPPTFPQPTSSSSLNYYISPENRTPAVLIAWHWILIAGGQILLPFLLATMILSRNVRRDPTLVNMIVTWILFTVMLSLLYYTGHDRGPEPPFGLCIAQASLLSGAPVMSTAAGLALVLQMFLGLRNLVRKVSTAGKMTTKDERRYKLDTRWRARALVSVPYILFFIFAITSLIIGLRDRSIVNRKRAWLFCSVNGPIVIAVSVASAVLAAITLILEIWIAVIFYKHGTEVASTKTESAFNVRLIIRVMVLSVYSALCWISFVIIRTKWDVVPWILTATVPLVAFVIFGSQKSVLRVWMFWVPRKPRVEMEPPSPMTPGVIYDPRKAPFGGIKMASFDQGSRPIIVTLPPRAHTPALGERKEPSIDRDGMVNVDLGVSNVKRSVDERGSDVEDVYGWEREYVRAATPAAV